ncbi:glutamine-rich protein 2-like [Amphibalanus amphitrite]|uniref:glutamine-rich protein 2-like n=1 Tax=Amphibalanus amphitrite TaxID=1232801 RepID=UPI001C90158F|nr:glutamine-rich protein 2-like [Amphibalanus amphitrite]
MKVFAALLCLVAVAAATRVYNQPGRGRRPVGVHPGLGHGRQGQVGLGQAGLVQPGLGQAGLVQPGLGQAGLVQPGHSAGIIPGGGVATGNAAGNVLQAQQSTPIGGSTQTQQTSAVAGGSASGLGSSSINQASSQGSQSTGLFGNQQSSNTDALSVQQGGGRLIGQGIPVGSYGK